MKKFWDGRSRRERAAFSLILAVPGLVLALLFLAADSVQPLTAPALLIDRVLLAASVVAIAGTVGCVGLAVWPKSADQKRGAAFQFAPYVAMLALAAVVLSQSLARWPAEFWPMVLAGATVLLAGSRVMALTSAVSWAKPALSAILTALLASALPLFDAWHDSAFLPSQTEAAVTQVVDVSLVDAALDDGSRPLAVTYDITNDTEARVFIIISSLLVCEGATCGAMSRCEAENTEGVHWLGPPIGERSWLSPESTLHWETTLTVPDATERVSVRARIAFTRGDRLRISPASENEGESRAADPDEHPCPSEPEACATAEAYTISPTSSLDALTHESGYLLYTDRDGDGGRNYFFGRGDVTCPPAESDNEVQFYGATDQTIFTERWLVDEAAPPGDTAGSANPTAPS